MATTPTVTAPLARWHDGGNDDGDTRQASTINVTYPELSTSPISFTVQFSAP
ncbi:hypothetical protein SCLCIDRAFT_1213197 [Scleroderma citrinum Foug A]|uniref:Uncharacterized protein n=1 Tax=Scleroderma citrinum Foug A TaxID=1036808 RepID=A0A0C3DVT7_9AGAM|nr:hypothetical protein SCLCIDRAFT_1213197 [Scleroderma citrinum Foug A]